MASPAIKGGNAHSRKIAARAAARKASRMLELNRGPMYPWWTNLSEARRVAVLRQCSASDDQCALLCVRDWDALPLWARRSIKRLKQERKLS